MQFNNIRISHIVKCPHLMNFHFEAIYEGKRGERNIYFLLICYEFIKVIYQSKASSVWYWRLMNCWTGLPLQTFAWRGEKFPSMGGGGPRGRTRDQLVGLVRNCDKINRALLQEWDSSKISHILASLQQNGANW